MRIIQIKGECLFMKKEKVLADEKIILTDEQIELIIKNTDASLAMEGFEPADFSNDLFKKYAKGIITEEEMLRRVKEYVLNLKK